MTDDEAVKRGAEAGWALAQALTDVCPDKFSARIAIMAAIAALELVLVPPAEASCHRFSIWHYPWPQRCHATATRALRSAPARAVTSLPPAPVAKTFVPLRPVAPQTSSDKFGQVSTVAEPPPPEAIEALRLAFEALALKRAASIPAQGSAR